MTDISTETHTERVVRLALALGRQNRIVAQVRALADFGRPVTPNELRDALTWPQPASHDLQPPEVT